MGRMRIAFYKAGLGSAERLKDNFFSVGGAYNVELAHCWWAPREER